LNACDRILNQIGDTVFFSFSFVKKKDAPAPQFFRSPRTPFLEPGNSISSVVPISPSISEGHLLEQYVFDLKV